MASFYITLTKRCNLRCKYCYKVLDSLTDKRDMGLSEAEIILCKIKRYALENKIERLDLGFTGGEVLLLGKTYLQNLFKLCQEILGDGRFKIRIYLQTNLTLVDEDFVKIFKDYKVAVDTSHDVVGEQRVNIAGGSVDKKIIDKIILMFKNDIRLVGSIVVINKYNYDRMRDIYDFYSQIATDFHTLHLDPASFRFYPKLTVKKYIKALKDLSRIYLFDSNPKISVQNIDSYVRLLKNGPGGHVLCTFSRNCLDGHLYIENNGDVYPCDSLRYREFYMGNLLKMSIDELRRSKVLRKLSKRNHKIKKECGSCNYLSICNGGCMVLSYHEHGDPLRRSKFDCEVNRKMFPYLGRILKKRGCKLAVKI